jgi:hypothetical protein
MTTSRQNSAATCYEPHEDLQKLLKDLKNHKGEDWRQFKHRVINKHIFGAMANLTFLLERMDEDPYIRKRFEKDIKALLLANSTVKLDDREKMRKYIFRRFIDACNPSSKGGGVRKRDFRLILCSEMQSSINGAMRDIGPSKFKNVQFFHKTGSIDIDRAEAWTTEFAQESYDSLKFDKRTRPALF